MNTNTNEDFLNACRNEDYKTAKNLVSSVDTRWREDITQETALHVALSHSVPTEIVEVLLENGAKLDATNKFGQNAVHAAAKGKNIDSFNIILSKATKKLINAKDSDDWTPAHIAASNGYTNKIIALAKKGASMTQKNCDDETPWDLARDKYPDIADYIHQYNKIAPTPKSNNLHP